MWYILDHWKWPPPYSSKGKNLLKRNLFLLHILLLSTLRTPTTEKDNFFFFFFFIKVVSLLLSTLILSSHTISLTSDRHYSHFAAVWRRKGGKNFLGLSSAFFGTGGLGAKAYSSVNWQLHIRPENWGSVSRLDHCSTRGTLWDVPKACSLHCESEQHLIHIVRWFVNYFLSPFSTQLWLKSKKKGKL